MMITEKLFEQDSHLQSFSARVLTCEPIEDQWAVVLDRTAFFPEGGGQPADIGMLGGVQVCDTRDEKGRILHVVDRPLTPGTEVAGVVDWPHRFALMQLHSGEHIVSGLVRQQYGFDNVGFHMGAETVTIDFNGELGESEIRTIEMLANGAIFANLPVEARYPDSETLAAMTFRSKRQIDGAVRVVTVPGYDACACCGVHVKRTGEIGLVKLLSCHRYKGGTRVEMVAGHLALRDYTARHQQITEISTALSAKPLETAQAVLRLQAENETLRRELENYREQRLKARAEVLFREESGKEQALPGHGCACIEAGLTPPEVRRLVMLLVEQVSRQQTVSSDVDGGKHAGFKPGWFVVLSPAAEGGCLYAAGVPYAEERGKPAKQDTTMTGVRSSSWMGRLTDARVLAAHLKSVCGARGGGSPGLVQGSASVPAEQMLAALRGLSFP